MKYFLFLLLPLLVVFPVRGFAHGTMMGFDSQSGTYGMMQYVEDQALGDSAVHEEMEGLMEKMMSGALTETEANRLAGFMKEYPGPYGMMMNRLSETSYGGGWGMMPGYGMGHGMMGGWGFGWGWSILFWICGIAWTLVGIFLLIYLWKLIRRK